MGLIDKTHIPTRKGTLGKDSFWAEASFSQ